MSSIKELILENQENEMENNLAKYLGISLNELQSTEYDFDEELSNDGAIQNELIIFKRISPEILNKIEAEKITPNTFIVDRSKI